MQCQDIDAAGPAALARKLFERQFRTIALGQGAGKKRIEEFSLVLNASAFSTFPGT